MSFFNFSTGIFGSPPRESGSGMHNLARSPSSPFCTSPSQLQEVTLDQDGSLSNTMGIRSPGGPMRGRTVQEFEEQLSNLKKENFNLKLRIYFLEEKMGTNFTLDKDNIVKKNIELQVQIANLQQAVNEKHELFCQAVKALEIEEDEHKKYSLRMEEQVADLQQEMSDLRTQLQDSRFVGNPDSPKSNCSSRQSEYIDPHYIPLFIPQVESKVRRHVEDGDSGKHQSHLASFVFDKTENLKHHIDTLQRECAAKDLSIDSLQRDLTSANQRLVDFAHQVKEYEEKLSEQHLKNRNYLDKIQEEQKAKDQLKAQLACANEKYSLAKYEFEQELEEFQREKKALERTNMMLDMRVSVQESDARKQKKLTEELQAKLEAALGEAKKNQCLAVSSGPNQSTSPSNTDARLFSVTDAATYVGAAEESAPHVSVEDAAVSAPARVRTLSVPEGATPEKMALLKQHQETGSGRSRSSKIPPTPDGKNLVSFEQLLADDADAYPIDKERLRADFAVIKSDFDAQKRHIVKLKSEQLKACEIIKNMISFRNKANDEIAQLKKTKEDLEKELENVVSKPHQALVKQPLAQRVSELNDVGAAGENTRTPPCELQTEQNSSTFRKFFTSTSTRSFCLCGIKC